MTTNNSSEPNLFTERFFTRRRVVYIASGILALILLLVFISSSSSNNKARENTPTITPTPTIALTPEELQIPEAPRQTFPASEKGEGILIVYSKPDKARVLVDAPTDEVTFNPSITPVPVKEAPFRMSDIPAGTHYLTAFKRGYLLTTVPFTIEAGKVTRVEVVLQPLPKDVGY